MGRCSTRSWLTTLLVSTILLVPSAHAETIELAHDQGKPSGWARFHGTLGHAVSFSPPSASWPIQRVRIYGVRFGNQTENAEFVVEVWAANKSVLCSASHPYAKFKTLATWVDIDIEGPVVSESFLVVIYTGSTDQRSISIAYDSSLTNRHSEVVSRGRVVTDWEREIIPHNGDPPLKKEQTNWMIRVVGGVRALTESRTTSHPTTSFPDSPDYSTLAQIAGVVATGGSIFAGWYFKTRKRRFLSAYLTKADSVFNDYYANREECKRRLLQMQDEVLGFLKKGKIDEPQYDIIQSKLERYLEGLT